MTEKRMAAELAACAPTMPQQRPISLLKSLGQDSSGRMGKLNMLISTNSHHGRTPLSSAFEPSELVYVKSKESIEFRTKRFRDQQTCVKSKVSPKYMFDRCGVNRAHQNFTQAAGDCAFASPTHKLTGKARLDLWSKPGQRRGRL
jgi:hypothetical protein